jgi:hypothetical protein
LVTPAARAAGDEAGGVTKMTDFTYNKNGKKGTPGRPSLI